METRGRFDPDDASAARAAYEDLATPASVVTNEVAKALDVEKLSLLVDQDVVATARDALFASLLVVHVGTREEYEDWAAEYEGDVREVGNENVDNVVWHAFADRAVAATFQEETDAAVATLRRQAFNRLYRELFYEDQ